MLAEPLQQSLLQIRVRRTLQIFGLYIVAFLLHYIHNFFSHFENREKCRLRDAMPTHNLRLCNLLLIHFLDYLVLLHERQEGPISPHLVEIHSMAMPPPINQDDSSMDIDMIEDQKTNNEQPQQIQPGRTSFVVEMSSGSSYISSSPSSSLDSCCSLIISALSRMPRIVMSSSAAIYSSYVQSGANLCHVSLSHGRVKVRGADEGAVDELGCGFV
uniref:Uncharacterized protein n=1 Tax=Timema tahoe TaxID=61484 RepID=A0A7R9IGC1_9NEOP|nr:unnamed protein product [Timema tahoe]